MLKCFCDKYFVWFQFHTSLTVQYWLFWSQRFMLFNTIIISKLNWYNWSGSPFTLLIIEWFWFIRFIASFIIIRVCLINFIYIWLFYDTSWLFIFLFSICFLFVWIGSNFLRTYYKIYCFLPHLINLFKWTSFYVLLYPFPQFLFNYYICELSNRLFFYLIYFVHCFNCL